jgi:hypothetical protein
MSFKELQTIFVCIALGLGLSACSDSGKSGDATSDQKMESEAMAMPDDSSKMGKMEYAPIPDYDPDVPSMIVEDNGVVSEDEIYRNWPE